jgi:hypothetical protein
MAFCTTCGADVTSKSFCVQCGTAVASAQPAAAPAAQGPTALAPQKNKVSPILWILLGIFGLFVLAGIAVTSAGLFLAHKVTQNPAMAVAKILTAANPDVEVLSTDEGRNTITFRDKKTRETVTMNFDDVKKGKIVFKGNGQGATIRARGDGDGGTLEINTPKGNVKFGAGTGAPAKSPSWVPAYPGATPESNFSVNSDEGEAGNFHFTTKDAAKSVLSFYEDNLKRAGFTISGNIKGDLGDSSGGILAAEDSSKHTVVVTVGAENGATNVSVVFSTKK